MPADSPKENAMRQKTEVWMVETTGPGFIDLTARVTAWLRDTSAGNGLVTVYVPHTSCSLTIQENTDPDVLADLADALARAAPREHFYRHNLEGPDDMPAHIKSMLTQTSISIPVLSGKAAFGIWQALYLIEHRDSPHQRKVAVNYIGT
jgi:secondary thiamine-phosphate synthase enzyme